MTDPSEDPRAWLDAVFAAALIAHSTIWDYTARLGPLADQEGRGQELLAKSAQITLRAMPSVAHEARRLRALLDDQEVLDAGGAEQTRQKLIDELASIEPKLSALRARQNALARELRRLLDEAR